MKLNIQNFFFIYIFTFLAYTFSIFSYSFFQQEEKRAEVIYKNLNTSIKELSYNLSKTLTNKDELLKKRALFERLVANDDFLKGILIFNDNKLLVSTIAYTNKIDTSKKIKYDSYYEKIKNIDYLSTNIRFFENNKPNNLLLIYLLEKKEINTHFEEILINFLINFVLFITIALLIKLYFLKTYISSPLEKLRQYAYYHSFIPKVFKIKELEAIRHSMVDSFTRLEEEKETLYHMARTDSLSGLANRNSLDEFLDRNIPIAKRAKEEFAYLFIDIDHFKEVNDSLGHNVGDELLKTISDKIKNIIRPTDFIARVGGDEFVIIIRDYKNYSELISIISRVHKYISTPWLVHNNPISINCSTGIAIYPKDGKTSIQLMKNADIAMYEAKKLGRNQYHFFTEKLNKKVQDIISLTKDMTEALKDNEYELYYQPKVSIKNSKICGVEALIRWNSKNGLVPPNKFIPLAEENNFILQLGDWIIDEALNQYILWKKNGIDLVMSINISAKQISQKNFAKELIKKIDYYEINYSKIDLEITEYMFLENKEFTNENLEKLLEKNISISLDDFGTGYSSLSYLKKFPINNLKIDKTFVDDYSTKEGSIFLETIVKMAQALNMRVIAEGIEEEAQLEYLKKISCDQYQGYYFSKPLKAKDLEELYFRIIS
jgi:diguanylate cyclase (GGDEF)-like protein